MRFIGELNVTRLNYSVRGDVVPPWVLWIQFGHNAPDTGVYFYGTYDESCIHTYIHTLYVQTYMRTFIQSQLATIYTMSSADFLRYAHQTLASIFTAPTLKAVAVLQHREGREIERVCMTKCWNEEARRGEVEVFVRNF